jgi:hypothetical protein
MTRTQQETLRDNNLGDTCPSSPSAPLRDPICDRNIFNSLLDEIYGDNQLNDTQATTNVVTLVLANTIYNLTFTKYGSKVHVFGSIKRNASSIPNNSVIANITNSEFAPLSGKQFRLNGFFDGSNNIIPFVFENTGTPRIRNFKVVPITEEYYINGFYLTNP